MRLLAASILTCLILSPFAATAAPAFQETCSCAADDGSCETNITCNTGGCFTFCPSNGCRSMCTNEPGTGSGPKKMPMMRVSLRLKGSNSRQVTAELARVTGQEVTFIPWTNGASIDLEVSDEPLWNVLEILSRSGRIRIGGDDFSNIQTVRRALLYGERMSVCVRRTTVKGFVEELEYLTGFNIQVKSGDPQVKLNFSAKGVNFDEILAQISERAGVEIVVR